MPYRKILICISDRAADSADRAADSADHAADPAADRAADSADHAADSADHAADSAADPAADRFSFVLCLMHAAAASMAFLGLLSSGNTLSNSGRHWYAENTA